MKNDVRRSALVLDGDNQATLTVVRSLSRIGVQVKVGANTARPIAGLSRFCAGVFMYPDPSTDACGFQQSLAKHVQEHRYSLIIPVTDVTICPLMEIRKCLEERSMLAMAANEALEVALSKSCTYDLARSVGIPVPRTSVIEEREELERVANEWGSAGYPMVVKPDRSKSRSVDGKGCTLCVSYASSWTELREKASHSLAFGPVVLQEHVRGEGVGVGLLASHGDVLFQCHYRRLHEVPLTGGGSSYRVTEAIDPLLAEWVSLLVKRLQWHGVAMVEFKVDRDQGKAWLMEINGRFWGALPLAVAAGADFPRYLFEHMVDDKHVFHNGYRVGLRSRNLAKEAIWLREALGSRMEKNALVTLPSYSQIFLDCCRMLNPKERTDTLDFRDPWPGLVDLYRIGGHTLVDVRNKLRLLEEVARVSWIRLNPKSLIRKLKRATNILVICSGNVIRSPFAANLLSNLIGKQSVQIVSAGLDTRPGRPADPRAVREAKQLGVDLSCHASIPVTAEMVKEAEAIFVMEAWQLLEMRNRFGRARRKTYLLTSLSPKLSRDIPDPMFKDEAMFAACFDQILRAVRALSEPARSESRSSSSKRSSESQPIGRRAKSNSSGLKQIVKRVALGFRPARKVLSWLARGHCPIFLYHRFGDNLGHRAVSRDAWCAQLDELKRSFQVLSLPECCRQRREGRNDWRGTCVITVDDGYRDFYEVAYPELKKRNLPATLFVTTGFLHPGMWLWWDVVRYVLDHTLRKSAKLEYSGGVLELDLATMEDRRTSWSRVGAVCGQVSNKEKWEIIWGLSQELGVKVPGQPPENYQGCTVAELVTMAEHGITFGPHSVTHPILTRCEPHEWQNEIVKSRERLSKHSEGYVNIFAFPNGIRGDYSDAIVQFLETEGFQCGLVAHYDDFRHQTTFTLRRCQGSSDFEDFLWKLYGGEYVWARTKDFTKAIQWGQA